jgi:hypothetical protein
VIPDASVPQVDLDRLYMQQKKGVSWKKWGEPIVVQVMLSVGRPVKAFLMSLYDAGMRPQRDK